MLDSPNGVVYATTSDMTTQAEPQKKKRPRLLMTSLVATLPPRPASDAGKSRFLPSHHLRRIKEGG
jgi:hypothetical protein